MDILTIDFETYWDDQLTLNKMLPMQYVTHPEVDVICCGFKLNDEPAYVVFGESCVREEFNKLRPVIERGMVLGHNLSGFDAMLAAWRFNVKPKLWGCTLAMAQAVLSQDGRSLSLASLAKDFDLGVKDKTALVATKGRRLKDFTDAEVAAMREYNAADVELCRALYKRLRPQFSTPELWQLDACVRQLVEPAFELDFGLLERALAQEVALKHEALDRVAALCGGVEQAREVLASTPKLAALLTRLGAEVPTKPSPANPDATIPALAKTDRGFIALLDLPDDTVRAVVSARLAVKSTLLETRIKSFIDVGRACGGKLPVPIKYCGASTTGRDSGWAYNCQNLPRVDPDRPKVSDALRKSLRAPKGYAVVVADLSGIELRVNMTLWKVPYAMQLLAENPLADLYKPLASEVLGVPIEGMPMRVRQAGKAMHLGCGYGLGDPDKYRTVAKQMALIEVSEEDAKLHIAGYRAKHPEVVRGWRVCHDALTAIAAGMEREVDPWGLVHTSADGLHLPSGRAIRYPNLRRVRNGDRVEWVYGKGERIYAGKVTENIVQALARDILKEIKLQVFLDRGIRSVLDVHDELVYVVPERDAEEVLTCVQSYMRTRRVWWPELVTWSEGDIAYSYGEAK